MRPHSVRCGFGAIVVIALVSGVIGVTAASGGAAPELAPGSGAQAAPEIADDRLLVGLEPGTSDAEARELASDAGARVSARSPEVLVLDPSGSLSASRVRAESADLQRDARVRYAEPNYRISASATPNDPSYSLQYALQGNTAGSMNAQGAWDTTTGGSAVVVGVLDSGVDLDHPDLVGNLWSNPGGVGSLGACGAGTRGYDFISSDCTPEDDPGLCDTNGDGTLDALVWNSHGTHVNGIVGAVGNNGTGVTGVNQTSSLMNLRMLDGCGSGSVADAVLAIDWALAAKTAGVNLRVLNASWGGPANSVSLSDAIGRAETAGVLLVTAAGNSAANLDAAPSYPCAYPNTNVVCVAASTSTDTLASFSSYGATSVDLAAPGVGIWSTVVPNVVTGCPSGGYCAYDGTSMASPEVAGGAALVLAAQPGLSLAQLRSRVLGAVDRTSALSGKVATGGRFDLCIAVQACAAPSPNPFGEFTPVPPARVLDTRDPGGSALGQGQSMSVQIAGRGGIPGSGVAAVVMNVTVDQPTGPSFLTVWPAGSARPGISNLNFVRAQTVPNLVTVNMGTDGKVSVYNNTGATHVVIDVFGYYASSTGQAGSRFHSVVPYRLFDTRYGLGGVAREKLGQGGILQFKATGLGGVPPSGVTAVVMNVTVTEPTAPGFITVFPADVARPNASNLNFVAGQTVPNLVTVRVSPGGLVNFFNNTGATHLLADVVGYYDGDTSTEQGRFVGITPARTQDTRVLDAPLSGGDIEALPVAGYDGIPASGASVAVMNMTVTEPTTSGFLTVFSDDSCTVPNASNLNFVRGQTVPNLVIVGLSTGTTCANGPGLVDIYNFSGNTHIVVDLFGYFTNAGA